MYVCIYKIFLLLDEKMFGALELSSASAAASRFAILLGVILTKVWFVLANETMTDSFCKQAYIFSQHLCLGSVLLPHCRLLKVMGEYIRRI